MGATLNQPEGDSEFWQKALHYHLGKYYRRAEVLELNQLRAVLFTSKDRKPFHYLVGVIADRKYINVVEVFFPHDEALNERRGSMLEALESIEVR